MSDDRHKHHHWSILLVTSSNSSHILSISVDHFIANHRQNIQREYFISKSSKSDNSGISFKLTEDQEALLSADGTFELERICPASAHHDHSGDLPIGVIREAWEQRLVNTHIPEEYGGLGLFVMNHRGASWR